MKAKKTKEDNVRHNSGGAGRVAATTSLDEESN